MNRPIIYQLVVRLFANANTTNAFDGTIETNGCGKFNDITTKALTEIRAMGFTHIWVTGIIEHSSTTRHHGIEADDQCVVKGKAGSPYAIRDYYDVAADLAVDVPHRMEEFESLVLRTHDAGLKILIDFIPNHLSRTYHSDCTPEGIPEFGQSDDKTIRFHPQNNFYYLPGESLQLPTNGHHTTFIENPARVTGNDCFSATPSMNDWFETIKLNYGVDYMDGKTEHFDPIPDTWLKMNQVLRFWANKGIDGFRCDMAAMVPLPFWKQAIKSIKSLNNTILFIAEIYEPWLYHNFIFDGGFDYLYDKVGLYDTLRAIATRQAPANQISNCWRSIEGMSDRMVSFIENHDEQRVASLHFAGTAKAGIPAFVVAALINRGALLLYNGQEVGEDGSLPQGFSGDDGRTSIFDYGSMPYMARWVNNGNFDGGLLNDGSRELRQTYTSIIQLINRFSAFKLGDFYDLMWVNHQGTNFPDNQIYVFLRHVQNEVMLVAVNFSPDTRQAKVVVPVHAVRLTKLLINDNMIVKSITEDSQFPVSQVSSGDLHAMITVHGFGFFIGQIFTS